jgi:glycosyltransferase
MLKVSVVTVVYNSEICIRDAVLSVAEQDYPLIEHIVIDGSSTDSTVDVAQAVLRRDGLIVSSPDHGIYDAMNKGFSLATGDIVSFLNADDVYASRQTLSAVVQAFVASGSDFIYGDILITDSFLNPLFYWSLARKSRLVLLGSQIPHPSLFVRRSALAFLTPPFDSSYRLSADLKQQLLLRLRLKASGHYLSMPIALMRLGGKSTSSFRSQFSGLLEASRVYREITGWPIGWILAPIKSFLKMRRLSRY